MPLAPDEVLDKEDPGDDVALRFQYQHCYAAIHALKTILPDSEVDEVVCENHEDILVRYLDGLFVAVQIKTRELSQPLFKANDGQVIKALARFALLETKFPGAFKCFEFLTNTAFWQEDKTESNLPYLLHALQARGTVKGLKQTNPLRSWVSKISELAGLSEEQVVAALVKCKATARGDTVESASRDVYEAIAECPSHGSTPFNVLRRRARALIALARDASTKSKGASVLALYEAGSNLAAILAKQQLEAKRIRKADVEETLKDSAPDFEALSGTGPGLVCDLPKTLAVLYQKLERGQLETDRVLQLETLVHQVEALYVKWANRYGVDVANTRMNDLFGIVEFDCTEAKVMAAKWGEPYASKMYSELYERLRSRCQQDGEKVYGCRPEHLMGTAGALTQDCKVWWSPQFALLPKDGA